MRSKGEADGGAVGNCMGSDELAAGWRLDHETWTVRVGTTCRERARKKLEAKPLSAQLLSWDEGRSYCWLEDIPLSPWLQRWDQGRS